MRFDAGEEGQSGAGGGRQLKSTFCVAIVFAVSPNRHYVPLLIHAHVLTSGKC